MTLFGTTWLLALVTTGLVAGAMGAHTVVLGTILTWFHADDRAAELRLLTHGLTTRFPRRIAAYWALYGLQAVAIVTFAVVAAREQRAFGLAAGAAFVGVPLWIGVHAAVFGKLEAKAMTEPETLTGAERQRFVRWNAPLHVGYALCLLAAFVLMALVPFTTDLR